MAESRGLRSISCELLQRGPRLSKLVLLDLDHVSCRAKVCPQTHLDELQPYVLTGYAPPMTTRRHGLWQIQSSANKAHLAFASCQPDILPPIRYVTSTNESGSRTLLHGNCIESLANLDYAQCVILDLNELSLFYKNDYQRTVRTFRRASAVRRV